jgi:hypothetical protein
MSWHWLESEETEVTKAPSYLHSEFLTQQTILLHIDTCKHPRFAPDSPSKNMSSFSFSRLFPSWFSPPSKPPNPDNVMATKRTTRAKRQKVSEMKDAMDIRSSSSVSSANSIVIGEGTEHLTGKHSPCIVISTSSFH